MFSVTTYINKGKDSNVAANLNILIPAGEVYYNSNNSYIDSITPTKNFCTSSVVINAISQIPPQTAGAPCLGGTISNPSGWTATSNPAGLCCYVSTTGNAWVAYVRQFASTTNIYCVDSRGVKTSVINNGTNTTIITGSFKCP